MRSSRSGRSRITGTPGTMALIISSMTACAQLNGRSSSPKKRQIAGRQKRLPLRKDLLRCHFNPETFPVTQFGTFTFGGFGISPHPSGMSTVATSRSLAMSLSSQ